MQQKFYCRYDSFVHDFCSFVHKLFFMRKLCYAHDSKGNKAGTTDRKAALTGKLRGETMVKREKKNKTPVIKNVRLVFSAMFAQYPQTRWQIPLFMVCRVSMPFLASLIPAVMIAAITTGDVRKFIGIMLLILAVNCSIMLVYEMLHLELANRAVYTRLRHFFNKFIEKNLETDYANVEPQSQQKMIQKGCQAIQSNWVGPERLTNASIDFVVHMFGMISYASVIVLLDIRIMAVLAGMLAADMLLRNHAMNYAHEHREENTEVHRKRFYLMNNSMNIQAGKDIRIYQMEHWFRSFLTKLVNQAGQYQKKVELRWYFPSASNELWICARDILTYFILIGKVFSGSMDIATFTLMLGMVAGFSSWVTSASEAYNSIKKSSREVDDLQAVMNMPDRFVRQGGVPVPGAKAFQIEFRDVSFRYPGAEQDTLSHLSFVITPGEKLALVGNNGAGKTTIVKLLCGLYMPTDGSILVDDVDIASMNLEEYQKLISVLFQDIEPLAFSIGMNVAGCEEEKIDTGRLEESLKKAGLWEKVQQLEQGTETFITQKLDEKGVQLSGGETQKLLLARAIYKDAPILILDEPTSALDPIAESAIYQKYNQMTEAKTSLFISHRLASTRFCDKILFLEQGQIVEEGSHEELMGKNGRYREIFEIQSHYYQEKEAEQYEV